jgi:hypothetical protein
MTISGLLHRLESRWAASGASSEAMLLPGLSPAAIRTAVAPHGQRVHDAVLDWFSWHDARDDGRWVVAPSGCMFTSLGNAIATRDRWLAYPDDGSAGRCAPTWLPILEGGSGHWSCLDVESGEFLTVDFWSADFVTVGPTAFDDVLRLWCDVLDTGAYRWNGAAWEYDFAQLPAQIRATGLVG